MKKKMKVVYQLKARLWQESGTSLQVATAACIGRTTQMEPEVPRRSIQLVMARGRCLSRVGYV